MYFLRGLGLAALGMAGLVVLSFLLDWTLEPPRLVRVVHALLSLAALGWIAWRYLFHPLSRSLSDEELALAIEHRVPALQDRLIGALQWEALLADPDCGESRTFMEASVVEAAERIRAVHPARLVDPRPGRRALMSAAGAGLLLLAAARAMPEETATWFRRSVLFADLEWPRRTLLEVLDFDPLAPRVITVGEDLPVRIRVHGEVPRDGIRVHYETATATPGGEARRDIRPAVQAADDPSLFLFAFQEVTGSFSFHVEGGDDLDGEPVYRVTALIPPALEQVTARLTFPPRTGLPPEVREEADLEVPAGTSVELVMRSTVPVTAAAMAHPADTEATPLVVEADGRGFRTTVVVNESADWRIDLVGADGAKSLPSRNTRRFTAIPDPRPEVRILHPFSRVHVTADGRVPVVVAAKDNYSLLGVDLQVRPGRSRDALSLPLATWGDGEESAGGGKRVPSARLYHLLDVAALAASSGGAFGQEDEILVRAGASDNGGSSSVTEDVPVQVTEPSELLRRLSQRQVRIREDLDGIRRRLRDSREAAIRAVDATASASLEAGDRDALRSPAALAGRAMRDSNALLDSLGEVVCTYVWNRLLDNRVGSERTVATMDDWLRNDNPPEGTPVFRAELWRRLSAAHAAGEIEDRQILGALLEALGLADRLASRETRELHSTMDGLAAGGGDDAALSRAAVKAADAALATLRDLELRLQDWESMHEILEKARSIRDLQRAIREKLEGSGKPPPGGR